MTPSEQVLRHFRHEHLKPGPLQQVSSVMANHAHWLNAVLPDGPEKTAGLRKLLEAKDCMVRAALDLPEHVTSLPWEVNVPVVAEVEIKEP